MNKQEIIDYLKGQTEWSGNHHYILVNRSELISMIEDLDELEFKNYLRDIKSQIDYLRIQGPGKVKSLRMLENMLDNMLTGYWSPTSIRTEKVKVPEFVAEWIEYVKKKGDSFYDSFKPWDLYGAEYVEADRWITNNGEEYARAWIDGYEVEEEPKYRVLFPCDKRKTGHQFSYLMEDGRQCYCSDLETIPELTESTIKSIDERYWPFAAPVEKV